MQRGNMNEEKEISESEMLSNLKTTEERAAFLRERDQRFFEDCANIGLAQYNAQNGTNFQLDKISCNGRFLFPRHYYYHVNFIAESSDGSNDEKKRRMFFAEVVDEVVTVCCILDPVAGMESGCEFCYPRVYHPSAVCLGPSKKKKKEEKIGRKFSNLKSTEENERGKGNMNEEKEITESAINEMLSNMKTMEERAVFRASPIYSGWIRKRDQRFFEDCAENGLAQYNAQNGTNFQLDKISGEDHCFFPGVVYFHLNFIAESSNGSNDEEKRRMFFAEVVGFRERVVKVCCILDPVTGMEGGCEFCDHTIHHPSGVCLGPPQPEKRKRRKKMRWG